MLLDRLGKGRLWEDGRFLRKVERAMRSSTARALGRFDGGLELLDCQTGLHSSFEAVSASPEAFTPASIVVNNFNSINSGVPSHLAVPPFRSNCDNDPDRQEMLRRTSGKSH
jgi:hypothetical protein